MSAGASENCLHTGFFSSALKEGNKVVLIPLVFLFFFNEIAVELSKNGKHGIQLIPGGIEIFMLLFADDVILLLVKYTNRITEPVEPSRD